MRSWHALAFLTSLALTACERENYGEHRSKGGEKSAAASKLARPEDDAGIRSRARRVEADQDQQLQDLLAQVRAIPDSAFQDPFGFHWAKVSQLAGYYGEHHPEEGLVWLQSEGGKRVGAVGWREFSAGVVRADSKKAFAILTTLDGQDCQWFAYGVAGNAEGAALEQMWKLVLDPGQSFSNRDELKKLLIGQDAASDPKQAYQTARSLFGEEFTGLDFIGAMRDLSAEVPFPVELLRTIPAGQDQASAAMKVVCCCRSETSIAPLRQWLESEKRGMEYDPVFEGMVNRALTYETPESARRYADRIHYPAKRAQMQALIDAHSQTPR